MTALELAGECLLMLLLIGVYVWMHRQITRKWPDG